MTDTKLIPSVTEEENVTPYTFKETGVKVYSFEEALYHCRARWKQSADDFTSEAFAAWLSDELKLTVIASKIRELGGPFREKYIRFMTLADYFEDGEINALKRELTEWENRLEWEKRKERGDYLLKAGEYEKAAEAYKKAAEYNPESAAVYNNLAVAQMKMGLYANAAGYLYKALEVTPRGADLLLYNGLLMHLAEALVYGGECDKARETLKQAAAEGAGTDSANAFYLYGLIEFLSGAYVASVPFYERAVGIDPDPHYIYCLADAYVKLRQYDKAIETVSLVKDKDKTYYEKLAGLYAAGANIPAAIKCVERALISDVNSVSLWTRLAEYHRRDYDLTKANSAIIKALSISKDNARANLEFARIRKAQGKIKDYQTALGGILEGFKRDYRDARSQEM